MVSSCFRISEERVENVSDYFVEGEEVKVKGF
ncbi:MAG: hypothetical protein Ct9H300mP20_22570 [Gammaproteobacteria bacterium]|nr:MAG: hypothetical protein Ct9H300mP20_22570 [Gammaproteobacteria bacterium]